MKKKKKKPALARGLEPAKKPSDSCFMIMPFGGYFDRYYEEIYKPAIENCNLRSTRADDFFRSSNIVNDIWELTKVAKLVIADLSNSNPNVFYELGIAHAITKPAIILSESMNFVPFDLRSQRVIIYDKNAPDWSAKLSDDITKAIKETLADPDKSIPPNFLNATNVTKKTIDPVTQDLLELRAEVQSLKNQLQSRSGSFITVGGQPLYPSAYNFPSQPIQSGFIPAHPVAYASQSVSDLVSRTVVDTWRCPQCGYRQSSKSGEKNRCQKCNYEEGDSLESELVLK